jgi:hypothetical protein
VTRLAHDGLQTGRSIEGRRTAGRAVFPPPRWRSRVWPSRLTEPRRTKLSLAIAASVATGGRPHAGHPLHPPYLESSVHLVA